MKKNLLLPLIFLIPSIAIAAETDLYCQSESDFALFECRVENVCKPYKPEKPTIKPKEYEEAGVSAQAYVGGQDVAPALGKAQELYRENMNNIYKCALIQAQKNALDFLKEQLKSEKSGQLDDTIGRQIESQMNRLDISANKVGCTQSDDETIVNKQNLLSEATYEACKHVSYMDYLQVYYSDIRKTLGLDNPNNNTDYAISIPIEEVENRMNTTKNLIANEVAHTYKVFPLVFNAYGEYEDNFPIHFLLEIIRADFVLLRQKMYENIMPIAQVGYKIINAMSK